MPPDRQVIVGLGNPGEDYADTRHNIGQGVLDHLATRLSTRFRRRGSAVVAETAGPGGTLFLAKPRAFMNVIGPSIARLLRVLALDPSGLILVYDDLDLPFGRVRVRHRGSHGGHNGVRSALAALGTNEVRRVRVGIGRPESRDPDTVADWVLTRFTREEREALPDVLARAAEAALGLTGTPAAR